MRTLALDGRMGASGDMLLGALLAAGADREALGPVAAADRLDVAYDTREVTRGGIAATAVDVRLTDRTDDGTGRQEHTHGDGHAHGTHDHAEGHGPTRTYDAVVDVVDSLALPTGVRQRALAVFERLGRAEAVVHGTTLADTTFHEVGADDAIADVVGVCLLLADLDPDRVVTTPPATGGGEVETDHGTYPVPVPAVVELAAGADWSLHGGPVEAELLTPTGAAILAEVAEGVSRLPDLRVTASGYGAGGSSFAEYPNVLRAIVGEGEGLREERVTVLETNLDDAPPELLGGLQRTLSEAGALDVTILPTTMKKSRPGHLVKVVCRPADAERVARRLAEETGTLGVREHGSGHRFVADREAVTATVAVEGERHEVAVKLGRAGGDVFDVSAEHDDAATVAAETGLAVREVARRAEAAVHDGYASRLVHLVEADRWAAVDDGDAYAPDALETAGFVRCVPPEQVVTVAEMADADAATLRLVVIDPAALSAPVRYEEQSGTAFAHVYGPVDPEAVDDVLSLSRENGRYVLPVSLS